MSKALGKYEKGHGFLIYKWLPKTMTKETTAQSFAVAIWRGDYKGLPSI